jgi:hypothetical protein
MFFMILVMDQNEMLKRLRAATEDDVTHAFEGALIERPEVPAVDLLEFFNRMMDVVVGDEEPGAPEPDV